MDHITLLERFHKELRLEAHTLGYTREETAHVIRHLAEEPEMSFIMASHLNEQNAVSTIQNELRYFSAMQKAFEWKVYSYDQPANLKTLLAQEGFTIGEEEALMITEMSENKALLTKIPSSTIQEITTYKGIQDIVHLENQVWNEAHEELGERLWHDKQHYPDSLFLYGIYEQQQLVSAAWMYLEPNSSFASLWGGSTLVPFRKKGYYADLLAIRAQKAVEKGALFLTVDASLMSKPILEKHHFSCVAYSYGCMSPSNS